MPTRVVSTPHLRRSSWWLLAACVAAIAYFTLLPAPGEPGTAFFCLVCGSRGGVDAILNVLLFAPLGIALVFCGVHWPRAILTMSVFSACIEATQFFAIPGRDATLGDIVMNTTGGAIGVAIAHWRWAWLRPSPRFAAAACVAWSGLWLGVQLLVSFAFAPSLPDTAYYGQIARSFASMASFEGMVLDARIGATSIPDRLIPDSAHVRALLASGAPTSAVVVPGAATPQLAPIVRIADRDRQEIVLLGQDGRAAIFALRTGAAALRLRPPLFRLPDALRVSPDASGADAVASVRLVARYGSAVHMSAERFGTTIVGDVPVVAGLGWTLVLPQQWYIDGSVGEGVITSLWIIAGVLPLGFWMAWLRPSDRVGIGTRGRATITVLLAAMLVCGLAIIPAQFGLAPATAIDWLSALAGIATGVAVALLVRRRTAPR